MQQKVFERRKLVNHGRTTTAEECQMKRCKVFKFLALAMALAMLLSITAFAYSQSVSFSAGNGVTATGSCAYRSATTSASSPVYIEATVEFTYYRRNGFLASTKSNASNAGVSITASVPLPSDFGSHAVTIGNHTAGSGSAVTEYS